MARAPRLPNAIVMRRIAEISRAVACLSCRRATVADKCWVKRNASAPDKMPIGQPENSARAAPNVALAKRQVSIIRNRVMAHPREFEPRV